MHRRTLGAVAILVGATVTVPSAACASYLLTRNATNIALQVNGRETAKISFRAPSGARKSVLLWGAVNTQGVGPHHLDFRIDRSGGWSSGRVNPRRPFRDRCAAYDGADSIPFLTAPICKAPDGSYWAVQKYQYTGGPMNDGGLVGSPKFPWQVRVSHWTGSIARIDVGSDWTYAHRYHHIFGRVLYHGANPFGGSARVNGACTSRLCRNISIDTLDSDFGSGWRRASSILVNAPNGQWCFAFVNRGGGTGRSRVNKYRVYLSGPGVSPDPLIEFDGPGNVYNAARQTQMVALQRAWAGGSGKCAKTH